MSIVTYVLVVAIELQSRRYPFLILTVAGKMFYKLVECNNINTVFVISVIFNTYGIYISLLRV